MAIDYFKPTIDISKFTYYPELKMLYLPKTENTVVRRSFFIEGRTRKIEFFRHDNDWKTVINNLSHHTGVGYRTIYLFKSQYGKFHALIAEITAFHLWQ